MDFDTLPDTVFLRIFDYLPLPDRFRVGRVSQSFLRMSQIVNGRIKSLCLGVPIFDKLDEDQLEVILCLCHHNLRELAFSGPHRLTSDGYLAATFSKFVCPQLVDLDLCDASLTDDEFARIVTNHPNLKRLKWFSLNKGSEDYDDDVPTLNHVVFPPVTLPHLETLDIQDLHDPTLERLIDRCPNLKTLHMGLDQASSEDIWDRFFRSVPHLESLELSLFNCPILMENLEWFWRLPLTSLLIVNHRPIVEFMINDAFVNKLVENFANIEHLRLYFAEANNNAMRALTRLEKLRVAQLSLPDTDFTNEAIRQLSGCRHLEELIISCHSISDLTFLHLFSNCPRLKSLSICGLDDDDGPVDASTACVLLSELTNVMPRRLAMTIEIRGAEYTNQVMQEVHSVWKSIEVQDAVQQLQQSQGVEILIKVPNIPSPSEDEEIDQDDEDDEDDEAMAMDEATQTGD